MKRFKKLGISLAIAFFAVCCGVVLLFNWSYLGWKALSIPTGSMRPTMPPGSLVLVHRVPVSSIKVGDVITYANPTEAHKTITHRVIRALTIDNGKIPAFYTKGDANPSADPNIVIGGQVQGVETWHVQHVGAWLTWGKGWPGIITLIYIPALLVIIEEVQRLNKYFKEARPYLDSRLVLLDRLVPKKKHRWAQATAVSVVLVAASAIAAFPAEALLHSNTVTLGPNSLAVAAATPPPTQCAPGSSGNNSSTTITINGTSTNNSTVVNNSSSQTATSGNVTSIGNTNSGPVTSGNASNCNSTTITINNP